MPEPNARVWIGLTSSESRMDGPTVCVEDGREEEADKGEWGEARGAVMKEVGEVERKLWRCCWSSN